MMWYSEWSKHAVGNVVQPSRWSDADSTRGSLREFPWDLSGINHLLQVLLPHTSRLNELVIGCQRSSLSSEIFDGLDVSNLNMLLKIVPSLSRIKVDSQTPFGAPKQPWIEGCSRLLHEAKQLRELYLTCGRSLELARTIFLKQTWPHLRVLDIATCNLDIATLRAVSHHHAETLRELRLKNMYIVPRSDDLGRRRRRAW